MKEKKRGSYFMSAPTAGAGSMNILHDLVQKICWSIGLVALTVSQANGELPNPVLETVFPPGGAAGKTVTVTITGSALEGVTTLHCSQSKVRCQADDKVPNRFRVSIPADTPPGLYDLWAVCKHGLSSPRPFWIGNRPEQQEVEPNESASSAQVASTSVVVNGRVDKGGDQDHFQFSAERGQRVVIECWAERIDSRLRAVLEVFASDGRRLAVNRGYFGIDPLIDFQVPENGDYIVRVHDLVFAGSAEHYYRLDIDTGPRVAFTVPSVLQRGKPARVTLHGWNLTARARPASTANVTGSVQNQVAAASSGHSGFDRVEVDLSAEFVETSWPLPVRLRPAQLALTGLAYHLPGSHASVVIGVTDVAVVLDQEDNHSSASAQQITYPCEVSGQLIAGDEQDWYAFRAQRGEVLYLEAFGSRINSPVDLELNVLDATGSREIVKFSDEINNVGAPALPSDHLDPAGRWVVPSDGHYLIAVRNLVGNSESDERRTYRLSVRREEPELRLAVVAHHQGPAATNVARGGRTILDLLAFRNRGLDGPIRVAATELPEGIECPEVWLGPQVNRGTIVISAASNAARQIGELRLAGFAKSVGERQVRGGSVVRTGMPRGWGRLTAGVPLSVSGEAALRITADAQESRDHHLYGELQVRHAPGGVLDVAVYVDRRETNHQAVVKIMGVGLPNMIRNQTAVIPAGQDKGYVSFYLPPSLPPGPYTIAIQAETTVPVDNSDKTETATVYSNAVNFDVHPPMFRLELDPLAPRRIKRGQVVQVNYNAHRINGFIGKIHTELASPGRVTQVIGLRGRGVSFVGQTQTGTVQIIANEDAPLGQQPFLRLYGVGVLEDEPLFHGSCFLQLEVVD